MKKINVLLCVLLSWNLLSAGIDFEKTNYETARQKAINEGKLMFIDMYASWCGPCKMLQSNTFPDANLGAYFNSNFISMKIDCEKDADGPTVCRTFGVHAYPTLVFIDPTTGKEVKRLMGYRNAEMLLNEAKSLNYVSIDQLNTMKKSYESGEKSVDFLKKYVRALKNAELDYAQPLKTYLSALSPEQLSDAQNLSFIADMADSPESPATQLMLSNSSTFKKVLGDDTYSKKLNTVIQKSITEATKNKDATRFTNALNLLKKSGMKDASLKALEYGMGFYGATGNEKLFLKNANTYVKKFAGKDINKLNDAVNKYITYSSSSKGIQQGVNVAESALKLENKYVTNYNLAQMYYKAGRYSDALAVVQYAIDLGKKDYTNIWDAQDLLNKIQASMEKK